MRSDRSSQNQSERQSSKNVDKSPGPSPWGFRLDDGFVQELHGRPVRFGFNGLGETVYKRTYSRAIYEGERQGESERWSDTVKRVVEGTFTILVKHMCKESTPKGKAESKDPEHKDSTESRSDSEDPEDPTHAVLDRGARAYQVRAQDMATRMFDLKFLPPGRGLRNMGTSVTDKGLFAALNNCAFVSTRVTDKHKRSRPFLFLADMLMLGVGVGFDSKGAGFIPVYSPCQPLKHRFMIEDSREGWVESIGHLLDSYFYKGRHRPRFDYGKIRPKGRQLRTFGGISSGPQPLRDLHQQLFRVLDRNSGKFITVRTINDICNLIGRCVVSGNIRRSAEISFGEMSEEFLSLKDYRKNPERSAWGWTANNSIFADVGMDYEPLIDNIVSNGEPGIAWLDNMRRYGRMKEAPNHRDQKVSGGNPCLEQSLESYEICCLVELFPTKADDLQDFVSTCRAAWLYGKVVTLCQTHWKETNEILTRNRRIGCSMTGIAQFVDARGLDELRKWCEIGYATLGAHDELISSVFGVPTSIKRTSVKPSGTVSLLAGVTPGIHYPIATHYIRRVRIGKDSRILGELQRAGYYTEPCKGLEDTTCVVEFPVMVGQEGENKVRAVKDVDMWEQLSLAAFMQRHWADNQVSATIMVDPKLDRGRIAAALNYFQFQLKGVSFLPTMAKGCYPQMPYEEITPAEYRRRMKELARFGRNSDTLVQPEDVALPQGMFEDEEEKFCDSDQCMIRTERTRSRISD